MTSKSDPLQPGSTIGILGGGQLGRMLALAAARLGFKTHIYCPENDSPASQVAARATIASYDDARALEIFAKSVDVVTYEFENVSLAAPAILTKWKSVRPSAIALSTAQDRLMEKKFLARLGIPVASFHAVESEADLKAALAALGAPAVLKTRRMGYDGKGQARIERLKDAPGAYEAIKRAPSILEAFVKFEREISVIAARGADGAFAAYCPVENIHKNHILASTIAPAKMEKRAAEQAAEIAHAILQALDYVGVIGVEMFDVGGTLTVNEIAPRVHNSGHWTIDACAVSQFEQHVRAICGWPLGNPERHSDAVMHNLIGDEVKNWRSLIAEPGACVHLYGKSEIRPGRKMGHVTRLKPKS